MSKEEEILAFFESLPNIQYFGNSIHLRKQEQYDKNQFWLINLWKKLVNLFKRLLRLQDIQKINHEEFFKQFLSNHGFKEIEYCPAINKKKNKQANKLKIDNFIFTCNDDLSIIDFYYQDWLSGKKLFIHEPFGRNSAPDFILIFYGYVYYVELKSSKGDLIKWNKLPDDGVMYLFSSQKFNCSSIFFGEDVVSKEVRQLFEALKAEISSKTSEFRVKFEKLENSHGWTCSSGAMFVQQMGGKSKTSVIEHPLKNKLEESALNRIKNNFKNENSNNNSI